MTDYRDQHNERGELPRAAKKIRSSRDEMFGAILEIIYPHGIEKKDYKTLLRVFQGIEQVIEATEKQ